MPAYFNENDPFAAQWLRNLIARNLIAPGDVDERSIADVRPDNVTEGYLEFPSCDCEKRNQKLWENIQE